MKNTFGVSGLTLGFSIALVLGSLFNKGTEMVLKMDFSKPIEAGKSTLINRFLDQQGSHKATVGLEYIYCKKGNLLCNIWEGGGNFDTNLIKMIQVSTKY